jgi:actin-related protein
MEVKVLENKFQRYAVWQGASLLANTESFEKVCHTREQYWDCGPSICRYNAVFSGY